ncbi:hypothetical protein CDL12_26186 [Handroanthus impetiginosus]|uniref:Uncharacterized protein n=1 Tax=Handroanthus impetiginosus TaxID=429701 RepID=A0A2G9G8J4_9LAMI|nr:hypothetical protein CDL12_26186 [Handroanthus impetiginosus]
MVKSNFSSAYMLHNWSSDCDEEAHGSGMKLTLERKKAQTIWIFIECPKVKPIANCEQSNNICCCQCTCYTKALHQCSEEKR